MRQREYNVMRLRSWEEYLSIISDSPYQHWAFRGQRDASAPLYSALSRYFMSFRIDRRAWRDQEERILRVFKRKAIHFLDHVPDKEDDFEWLALMQDHGAPTRLLDFSWSLHARRSIRNDMKYRESTLYKGAEASRWPRNAQCW